LLNLMELVQSVLVLLAALVHRHPPGRELGQGRVVVVALHGGEVLLRQLDPREREVDRDDERHHLELRVLVRVLQRGLVVLLVAEDGRGHEEDAPVGAGHHLFNRLHRSLFVAAQVRGEQLHRKQRRRRTIPHLVEDEPVLLLLDVGAVHEEFGVDHGVVVARVRADRFADGLLVAAEVEVVLQAEELVVRHDAKRCAAL